MHPAKLLQSFIRKGHKASELVRAAKNLQSACAPLLLLPLLLLLLLGCCCTIVTTPSRA
jgi:hypothetical protein